MKNKGRRPWEERRSCTFGDLLVQTLEEDALVDVLHVDVVGVIRVDGLVQTLELLQRDGDGGQGTKGQR